jgi:hypothetical protein
MAAGFIDLLQLQGLTLSMSVVLVADKEFRVADRVKDMIVHDREVDFSVDSRNQGFAVKNRTKSFTDRVE